jgi:hypothetical protein
METSLTEFQGLKPKFFWPVNVAAEAATHKACCDSNYSLRPRKFGCISSFVGQGFSPDTNDWKRKGFSP